MPFTSTRGTRPVPIDSGCGIVSVPTYFSIKNEEYPLERRFYAYNRAEVGASARQLLDLLDFERLDTLIETAGYIDLGVIEQPQIEAVDAVAQMLVSNEDPYQERILEGLKGDLESSIRLSTSFRFTIGAPELDSRARIDVARIVDYIKKARPKGVHFAGFTATVGTFEANVNISRRRANAVRQEVLRALPEDLRASIKTEAAGYGELFPIACNDIASGRLLNHRVQVWVQ